MALWAVVQESRYRVAVLLTTITEGYDRISMHGVRRALLEQQAVALGLSLHGVLISPQATNEVYEARMEAAFRAYREAGVTTVAFGDLFLEDIRRYREEWLARIGMRAIFPLWHKDTTALARAFVDLGFKATVACVDSRVLDRSFAGRTFDHGFLGDLPARVDPCGENGEFHTFVHHGPLLCSPVALTRGEVVRREFWYFCDLLPAHA
ncbi:MAG: adenine nucleotide alpha hydrolase [Planctomycetes bacterium]|nr:adenine nucleotide alpha hydrolase [Chloroflexota bacterium]MBM4029302.1 adenine nucleotide alpha hydrolase [Planctomycetota bacterium]